jgi:hypothetical protein
VVHDLIGQALRCTNDASWEDFARQVTNLLHRLTRLVRERVDG